MHIPTYSDVVDAQPRVYAHMLRSALLHHPLLDEWVGATTWVKHENHNPTGAFKVRGGLNLVSRLTPADRARGVISASTGNHGQSIAFASRLHGVPCHIFMPVGSNPDKKAAIQAFGATVVPRAAGYFRAPASAAAPAPSARLWV